MMNDNRRIERIAAFTFIIAVMVGCAFVLRPFVLSILWAIILCVATWPVYEHLLKWLPRHRTLVAALMTVMLLLVLFIPFLILGLTFTDSISSATQWLESHQQAGLPLPPPWVERIPLAGNKISGYWSRLATSEEPILNWFQPAFKAAGLWLLKHSLNLGQGIFNLAMSVIIVFFLYRDGNTVAARIREAFQFLSPDHPLRTMDLIKKTIQSVIYGTLGTALAQAFLAGFGFAIAGLPSPILLAMLTFFFSFFGAPFIVWIGASAWLFAQGQTGWGVFMLFYGILFISSVDNVIKPYFISRGSNLPFIVTFIGVLGGVLAFGFIGVFLGPTLLAVGYALTHDLLAQHRAAQSPEKAFEGS